MFEKGSFVVYGANGVCTVSDRRTEKQCGADREYYVLTPLGNKDASIFVPTDNETLVAKMRNLLSRDEITELVLSLRESTVEWERDNKKRNEYGNAVLARGDRGEMLSLVRSIYIRKKELSAVGKHLPGSDDGLLKKAEKLINEEFAVALGISSDEVPDFIKKTLESTACT